MVVGEFDLKYTVRRRVFLRGVPNFDQKEARKQCFMGSELLKLVTPRQKSFSVDFVFPVNT